MARNDRDRRMQHNRCARRTCCLLAAAVLAGFFTASTAAAGRIAARAGAEEISCEAFGALDVRSCALGLLREIRTRAEREFVVAHGLEATATEIEVVRAHERAFDRHDQAQRAQKLEEVEARLVHMGYEMSAAQHARLIEFRSVLRRLAAYEADVARGALDPPPELPTETVAHWVEQAKLDPVLYQRYGGTVGLKASGAYAHSARAALAADYMRDHGIEVPEPEIEVRLQALLRAPPPIVYHGTTPDFTPFWMRPLVPSYIGP